MNICHIIAIKFSCPASDVARFFRERKKGGPSTQPQLIHLWQRLRLSLKLSVLWIHVSNWWGGGPSLPQRVIFISQVAFLILSFKGDSLEETLVYSKLEFSSPVPLVYLFKNGSCQFLSHWAGSQLIQCFAVRNSVVFLAKTKTKAWFSVIWREDSNLLYDETIYVSSSSTRPPLAPLF